MRYGYFTQHPQDGIGTASEDNCVHASQGLDMEALCGWGFVGHADPSKSQVHKLIRDLLAEVTCPRCIDEILQYEAIPRSNKQCSNCGAPEGEPCEHDAGCIDADRTHGETNTYVTEITLTTENGELPTPGEVETMIREQLAGTLDDDTGLFCIGVTLRDEVVSE